MTEQSIFIYALVDPRANDIRYVGQSIDPAGRFRAHLAEIRSSRASLKINWLRSLANDGLSPDLVILDEVVESLANAREIELIAKHRSPRLTNMTDGGDGTRGWTPSAEFRANASRRMMGRQWTVDELTRRSATRRGVKTGPAAHRDRPFTQAHRDAMSRSRLGMKMKVTRRTCSCGLETNSGGLARHLSANDHAEVTK